MYPHLLHIFEVGVNLSTDSIIIQLICDSLSQIAIHPPLNQRLQRSFFTWLLIKYSGVDFSINNPPFKLQQQLKVRWY